MPVVIWNYWIKRAKEWGSKYRSQNQYLNGARKLLNSSGKNIHEFTSRNGWYFKYNSKTNEFICVSDKGTISSYLDQERVLDIGNLKLKNINSVVLFLKRKCPCCGCKTLNTENNSLYEICPVCFWEYDPIQNDNPNYSGGANSISLFDAIHNYQKYGAISKEYISFVRKPYKFEK